MEKYLSNKIQLFKSDFKGREDVFAIRWEKGNKRSYIPAYFYDPYMYRVHKMKGGTFQNYNDKTYLKLTDQEIAKPDNEVEDLFATGVVMTTTLPLAITPVTATVVGALATAALVADAALKRFITYILKKVDGSIEFQYCGRTGGFGDDETLMNNRLRTHKLAEWGVTPVIDKEAYGIPWGYYVIRDREQQNIDYYGGSKSSRVRSDATCVNEIRRVRRGNPNGYLYYICSNHAFGEKHPYTGYTVADLESAISKAIKKFNYFFK